MPPIGRKQILKACYVFLVPVVRFLLRSGVSFREFVDLARVAYINVASEDYGIRGRPTNISRVAAMTGIPRKDVRRLRLLSSDYSEDPRVPLSPLGDVLQLWCTSAAYLDDLGEPVPLRYAHHSPSFTQLVQEAAGDVPPGALRVELLRLGTIEETDDGMLKVVRREIVPNDVDERLLTSLAFSLKALASTIAFNTDPSRQEVPRVERFVQSPPISEQSRQQLSWETRQRIISFTEAMDDLLSKGEQLDAIDGGRRIGVGVYYYEDID